MRNPIQSSPERPIPLPDCILLDSWWTDLSDSRRERREPVLRLAVSERDEGRDDRHTDGRRSP
jgi:hypothetical protein